jgi:tRNA(fMet)-specific endonuclease VapC
MAVRKVLLDTNAYVALMRGDERVVEGLAAADLVYLSVVVLGELEAGFRGGSQYRRNRDVLEDFLSKQSVDTLPVSRETADVFGELKSRLKTRGKLLPINDVWLAAHAMETGAVLVTYDAHFAQVAGLRTWRHLT